MFDLYWICSDDMDVTQPFVRSFETREAAMDYARAFCGPYRGFVIKEAK